MPTPARRLASALLLSGLAACSSSTSTSAGGALKVTAAPTRIRANGTATSQIHVEGSAKPPIQVTASRGTFQESGTGTVSLAGASGDVTLVACDGATDTACKTSISVSAADGAFATGQAVVSLIARETICNDGIDNNGDGNIDCADPDCNAQACKTAGGNPGTCQGTTCVASVCTPTPGPETICNDGIDNDCNNLTDCADSACDGKQCGATAASVCQNKTCVNLGAGIGLAIAVDRSRLPADGAATTAVTVTVTQSGAPAAGLGVTLHTTLGGFVGAAPPGDTITVAASADGKAVATFLASGTAGIATLTASPQAIPQLTVTAQIAMPALGSIGTALDGVGRLRERPAGRVGRALLSSRWRGPSAGRASPRRGAAR